METNVSKFVRLGMPIVGGLLFIVFCLSVIVSPSYEIGANSVTVRNKAVQLSKSQSIRLAGTIQATKIPTHAKVTHSLETSDGTYYLEPSSSALRRRLVRLETKSVAIRGKIQPTLTEDPLRIVTVSSVTTSPGRVTVIRPSTIPSPAALALEKVAPSSGPINTEVILTGTGFAKTGNSININNVTGVRTNVSSPDGKTIKFTVPAYPCSQGTICIQVALTEGTYDISVTNADGKTSNTIPYTITK